jgi:hypothetical protein
MTSLLRKLREREMFGSAISASMLPRRTTSLQSVVDVNGEIMQGCTLLGVTKCGRYVVSYTSSIDLNPVDAEFETSVWFEFVLWKMCGSDTPLERVSVVNFS